MSILFNFLLYIDGNEPATPSKYNKSDDKCIWEYEILGLIPLSKMIISQLLNSYGTYCYLSVCCCSYCHYCLSSICSKESFC